MVAYARPCDHIVQLCQDQNLLKRAVCRFADAALANGEGMIMVPTLTHWDGIRPRLEAEGHPKILGTSDGGLRLLAVRVAVPPPRAVRSAAIDFLLDAYDGVPVRAGKGLPHAQAVADILREAGADEQTQIAGLLHDVVEDTRRGVDDVRAVFGDELAAMVDPLTEDNRIDRYGQRKRVLRARIAAASHPGVMDVALADKIATLRHAAITGTSISRRKLAHYRATLRLGLAAGAAPPLTTELSRLLVALNAWP